MDTTSTSLTIEQIRDHIRVHCPYAGMFQHVEFRPTETGIELSGHVTSYYLRQILMWYVMDAAPGLTISDRVQAVEGPH